MLTTGATAPVVTAALQYRPVEVGHVLQVRITSVSCRSKSFQDADGHRSMCIGAGD